MEEEFESEEGDFLSKADYDAVVQKVCQNLLDLLFRFNLA